MTADELDVLAVVQAAIRARYARAQDVCARWEPAPFVPTPSERKAAADVDGVGTSTAVAP